MPLRPPFASCDRPPGSSAGGVFIRKESIAHRNGVTEKYPHRVRIYTGILERTLLSMDMQLLATSVKTDDQTYTIVIINNDRKDLAF